jgi:tight adherence protein C
MSPALATAGLATCFLLAGVGVRLLRDRGPINRFERYDPHADAPVAGTPPLMRLFVHLSDRLAPRALGMLSPTRRAVIQRRIDAAGKPGGLTLQGYAGRKAAFTLLFSGAGALYLVRGRVLTALLLAASGWLLYDLWLSGVARRRQALIESDLPDFLDILAVTVGAGLGFRDGLARVAETLEGPLAEEMLTALRQMDLGASRRDAFKALAERNDSESLGAFVSALLQAEELGAPLADTLRQISTDMRRITHQQARQQAARAAPRVSLVVTTMILPAVVILIGAALWLGSDFSFGDLLG